VAEQGDLLNAEFFQQLVGIDRQLLEAVLVAVGLARGAEADLVGCDHAVTGVAQRLDRTLPCGAAEVLAVQQHHAATVGGAAGRDVHVAHVQGFALGLKAELLNRIRVLETLQFRPVAGAFGGGECGRCAGGEQAGNAKGAQ
jgi:hypothetical protein